MAIVGVIAAAGYATRLQPLSGSKEVLSIRGKPIMDHLVERMRAGGCTSLRVVTRRDKRDVIAHGREIGAEVVLAEPDTVSASFVAGMHGLADEDIVLIGFPDTLWEPSDGYLPLVQAVEDGADAALGLFRIPVSDRPRSDVVILDRDGGVTRIDVKPSKPASDRVWGCAAARARALSGLAETDWPGAYFDRMCREGRNVRGIYLSDVWLDIGTKGALERVMSETPS